MSNYAPRQKAQCPHCQTTVLLEATTMRSPHGSNYGPVDRVIFDASNEKVIITASACPACGKPVITLSQDSSNQVVHPLQSSRKPVPAEVPDSITNDYNEAALVIRFSPKASAALSRRCLQSVLREQGFNEKDLWQQIDAAIARLPSYIAENVDAVRHIGNFAAHPIKSTSSAEIVDVEPGEAEWNLDVLDQLFDFYYIQPAAAKAKRDALNAKLADAGKRPMK